MSLTPDQVHLQKRQEFHQAVQKFELLLADPFPDDQTVAKLIMASDIINQTSYSILESMMKNSQRKKIEYETHKKTAQA
jgi:hypothetical protein